jgi:hypothetical protein
LCSSKCDAIFNISNNETAITDRRNNHNSYHNNTSKHQQPHNENETNSDPTFAEKTPAMFVRLDNGTLVLNDYSSLPDLKDVHCPALFNITQSTQQCSISQVQATVTSSANSFNYFYRFYPPPSSLGRRSISGMMSLLSSLAWNLLRFIALQHTLLQLATAS